jgi:predicted RNA-binding Zn-ribbon protein involved in translation (DUF1610 family)
MFIFPSDDFLLWHLIFKEGDNLTCPHCGGKIERYEIDKDFGDSLICPRCGEEIKEEGFKGKN